MKTITFKQLQRLIREGVEDYNDDKVDFDSDNYSTVSKQKKAVADKKEEEETKNRNNEFIEKYVPYIKNGLDKMLDAVGTQFPEGQTPKVFGYMLNSISKALDKTAENDLIVPVKMLTAAIDETVRTADNTFTRNNRNPVDDKKKSFMDKFDDFMLGGTNSFHKAPLSVKLDPETKKIKFSQIHFSTPITLSKNYKYGDWYSSIELKEGSGHRQMQRFTELVADAFPTSAKIESYYDRNKGLFFNFYFNKSGKPKFDRANWYFESNENDSQTMTMEELRKLIAE